MTAPLNDRYHSQAWLITSYIQLRHDNISTSTPPSYKPSSSPRQIPTSEIDTSPWPRSTNTCKTFTFQSSPQPRSIGQVTQPRQFDTNHVTSAYPTPYKAFPSHFVPRPRSIEQDYQPHAFDTSSSPRQPTTVTSAYPTRYKDSIEQAYQLTKSTHQN